MVFPGPPIALLKAFRRLFEQTDAEQPWVQPTSYPSPAHPQRITAAIDAPSTTDAWDKIPHRPLWARCPQDIDKLTSAQTFSLMDKPLALNQPNIDTRIRTAFKLLKVSTAIEGQNKTFSLTPYKFFKVIKQPGDVNGGVTENEIQLYVIANTSAPGPLPPKADVIIALRIAGQDVLSGKAKVTAEILNTSDFALDIQLGHDSLSMNAPTSKPVTVRLDKSIKNRTRSIEGQGFGECLKNQTILSPVIKDVVERLRAYQTYRGQRVDFPGTWMSDIYPFYVQQSSDGALYALISVGWPGYDDEGIILLEATAKQLKRGRARLTLLDPAADIHFSYDDPKLGPVDISCHIDPKRKGYLETVLPTKLKPPY